MADDAHLADEEGSVGLSMTPTTTQDEHDTLLPKSPMSDVTRSEAYTPISNSMTGAALSAATYSLDDSAFATWCEALNSTIHEQSRALQNQVMELQKEFEDASQYIRGDFAWRRQVAQFHDRTNDVLASAMLSLSERLQQSTQSLSVSLGDTLKVKDSLAKEEMQRQMCMYEDKLRRTRTSLKKEVDRFTHLEKCLRKEETHQAKAMYDRLVHQLTLEYTAKEATLQAMLRELKVSHLAVENANTQLMSAVKGKDEEIERLKKLLPKATTITQRGTTAARPGSAAPATTIAAAASEAYVQSLKQSLQSANSTVEVLRKQVEETSSDKEQALKKVRQAEDAAAKTTEEFTKVKQLLSESHTALLANRTEVESLLQEKAHWKELYTELHFQSGSHSHAFEDAKRLAEAAQTRAECLQTQLLRRSGTIEETTLWDLAEQWEQRRGNSDKFDMSREAARQFIDFIVSQNRMGTENRDDDTADCQHGMEAKVRLEFEKKYGDMLNLRISHERKRVLARIEMIWNKRVEETCGSTNVAKTKGKTSKESRRPPPTNAMLMEGHHGASLKQVLHLVTSAFNDLGFSDWASTDIDMLHGEILTLRRALEVQQIAYDELQDRAEAQALSVARTDLHLREKEMLLAALTDRCRVLRAHVEKLQESHGSGVDAPAPLDLSRWDATDPFTVIGRQQPMEEKRRSVRVRPASASATLTTKSSNAERLTSFVTQSAATQLCTNTAERRSLHRTSAPKAFLLSQLPSSLSRTPQEQEDHVRSVLKADLLSLTPAENQLEDGSHVGSDGVLQIMQRRRHRKC